MRIPGYIALSLLSSRQLMEADGAAFKHDPKRYQRMLQRVESASGPGARRLQNGNANGKNKNGAGGATDDDSTNGNKGGNSGGNKGGSGGGGGPKKTKTKGLHSNKRDSNGASHSAHLDTNDYGITPDPEGKIEYGYGDAISMTIEMTNDLVPEDIRKGLDLSLVGEWRVGAYMRMADVNSNDAIVTAIPSITCEEVAVSERKLQDAPEAPPEDGGEGSNVDAEPETPDGPEDPEPVDLSCTGTATITDTQKNDLKRQKYGDGFDVYVIDGDGKKISGPMTVYFLQSDADLAAEDAEAKSKPDHILAKFNHAGKKKGHGAAVGVSKKDPANAGEGSGMDGKAIISTTEGLANYVLEVDADDGLYVHGDVVTVTYDLSPAAEERRRLQGNLGKNGNNGNGNGNGKNGDTGATDPPPSEEEEETTGATDPATDATGTPSPEDEADVTTTGPTEPEVDMGAGDTPVDPEADVEEEVDPDDVTKYVMAVFMRMAHPQRGALEPILKEPFCAEDPCTKTIEELEAGSFAFDTAGLDSKKYGLGYDLWVLNGLGEGKAGPVTFYLKPEGGP